MRRVIFLLAAAAAAMVMVNAVASAQTIPRGALDANCPGPRDFQAFIEDNDKGAQTFTAVRSGKLTAAEVLINEQASTGSNGNVVLKIAKVGANGKPTNDILTKTSIPDAEVDDTIAMRAANFNFKSAAKVVAGKQYALIVHKSNATHFNWFGRNNTSCPGDAYLNNQALGNVDFVFNVYVAPANDDFAFAKAVKGRSVSVAGTTLGASRQQGEPDHYTPVPGDSDWSGEHTVWYRWKAPASGQTTIDTCTANIDSILAVYTGKQLNALNRVADNNNGCPSGFGSKVVFSAKEDKTYRIAVGDAGGAEENTFTLNVQGP